MFYRCEHQGAKKSRLSGGSILQQVAMMAVLILPFCTNATAQDKQLQTLIPDAKPMRSCESLASIDLSNTTIDSAIAHQGDEKSPPSCRIVAIVTHPPAGDQVKVFIGLPMEGWNGRFMGTGGGGFSGGSERSLIQPLSRGYAVGATDTGHEGGSGSFALA